MKKAIIFLCVKEDEVHQLSAKLAEMVSETIEFGLQIVAMFAGVPEQAEGALESMADLIDDDEEYFLVTDSPVSFMNAYDVDFEDAVRIGVSIDDEGSHVLYTDDCMDERFEEVCKCDCCGASFSQFAMRDREYVRKLVNEILRAKIRGFLDDIGKDEEAM